jgi:DNA-directed RNA polymerase I subunit RPA49
MTKWHVDKLIMYICALALHIDNFELSMNDLQDDLRLNPNEMQRYFSELGCKISALTAAQKDALRIGTKEAGSYKMARLQLPLEFPKQRSGKAGQRR